MAETERKYQGSLTLEKLEIALEAEEELYGCVKKLEALGGFTIATYDDSSFPPALHSLTLKLRIGGAAPPAPAGATHLFDGKATIVGAELEVSVYRTG